MWLIFDLMCDALNHGFGGLLFGRRLRKRSDRPGSRTGSEPGFPNEESVGPRNELGLSLRKRHDQNIGRRCRHVLPQQGANSDEDEITDCHYNSQLDHHYCQTEKKT